MGPSTGQATGESKMSHAPTESSPMPRDPARMTPEERLAEVAAILALADISHSPVSVRLSRRLSVVYIATVSHQAARSPSPVQST